MIWQNNFKGVVWWCKRNFSVRLYCCPTRIILTWTPSWKKAQIWGATSSHAFPIVLSLSSSSNVVFAYGRDVNVCVHVNVTKWLVFQHCYVRKLFSKINIYFHKCQYLRSMCKYRHLGKTSNNSCTGYTCTCVQDIQKLKCKHCHCSPNLLLHTIPTSNSLWKQALQRQHTHSHKKNSRGPVQITSNCETNALCAKLSNIYCTLIVKTMDVCGYSALCGKYQRLAISVCSHVQWGMKALKSTPN